MPNYSDLNITPEPNIDKNFFNFKATNLKIAKTYAIKFQWVYPDGSVSPWSSGKFVTTNTESVPAAPTATVTGGAGFIKVELPTFPANALRVDVRISGGIFGDGTKVSETFTAAGTKTITAPGGAAPGFAYTVTLLTVTPSKINGNPSSPVTVYVTDPSASLVVEPSATPSTPTVSSVVGAIQLSWNGKKSDGGNQPAGFKAAKVYVGTTAGFTPIDSGNQNANQVDVLDFGNGQNTLNIGVGTVVNGVAITYDTDYYVKIKTTNGNTAQDSAAVSATGSPVQIGKVGNNGLIEITADKITTGTLQSNSTVTVGASGGRRVELRGSGVPFEIFGTGGSPLLSYNASSNKLSITGEGTFSGALQAASGDFTGSLKVGSSSNPVITNITSDGTYVTIFAKTIIAVGDVISISGVRSSSAFVTVTNAVGNGTTVTYTGNNSFSIGETVTVSGITPSQYNLKGVIVNRTNSQFIISSNKTGAYVSGGVAGYPHVFDLNNVTVDRITDAVGNHITAFGVDTYAESFRVLNSTSGAYTSEGSIVRSTFQVGATGILKAAEGIIGGWLINGSKLVSSGTLNRIELNPLTPKIVLIQGGTEKITIDPAEGIVGPTKTVAGNTGPAFKIDPEGNAQFRGVIYAASGEIGGWTIGPTTLTGGLTTLNSNGTISGATITSGAISSGTITGSRIQTATDSNYGSIRIGYAEAGFGAGSTIELVGANNTVVGQLYNFGNNEVILRHGSSREIFGYPTSSPYISLNPNTLTIGHSDSTGQISRGLTLESTLGGSTIQSATFVNMAVSAVGTNSSGGSGGLTTRYFRNTVINNTAASGSGYNIGDIWIQY